MAPIFVWMDSILIKISNEFKIIQFEVRTKTLWPREVEGKIFQDTHAAPLKFCEFSVYLMSSIDSKFDMDKLYSLLNFRRDKNHGIWRFLREL